MGKSYIQPSFITQWSNISWRKLGSVEKAKEIGSSKTIVNLRKGPDPAEKHFNAEYFHFPISNDYGKYETSDKVVRKWLQNIFLSLEKNINKFPVLFHCTSGKD